MAAGVRAFYRGIPDGAIENDKFAPIKSGVNSPGKGTQSRIGRYFQRTAVLPLVAYTVLMVASGLPQSLMRHVQSVLPAKVHKRIND